MSAINTIKAFRAGVWVEQPVLLEALDTLIEQAEENNRLREALKEISEMYSDGKSPVLDHWGMLNVARQALEIRHE